MTITRSPTNWPNPERPGEPMFPERDGKHAFYRIDNGEERIADWDSVKRVYHNAPFWSRTPGDMARYYKYGRCISVKLTPAQINEMLAAERERCAKTLERDAKNTANFARSCRQNAESTVDDRRMSEIAAVKLNAALTIRNLGAAP